MVRLRSGRMPHATKPLFLDASTNSWFHKSNSLHFRLSAVIKLLPSRVTCPGHASDLVDMNCGAKRETACNCQLPEQLFETARARCCFVETAANISAQIALRDGPLALTDERVPKVSCDIVDEAMYRRFSDPMPGDRVHRFSYSAEWWLVSP